MKEYATTHTSIYTNVWDEDVCRDYVVRRNASDIAPISPDGTGWEMCGAAATKTDLYWFWQRKIGGTSK